MEKEPEVPGWEQERQVSVLNGLPREDHREMTLTETGWRRECVSSETFEGKSTVGIQKN